MIDIKVYGSEIYNALKNTIPKNLKLDNLYFVCIGTDRSTGDSLGPLVGTILTKAGYKNVMGTLDNPIHAMNLDEVDVIESDKTIIAIDASLGNEHSIKKFDVFKGPIKPGAGVGKNLKEIGDYSITGIVNVGGFMEYFVLQNTRLSLVMDMAEDIANAIIKLFPLNKANTSKGE